MLWILYHDGEKGTWNKCFLMRIGTMVGSVGVASDSLPVGHVFVALQVVAVPCL